MAIAAFFVQTMPFVPHLKRVLYYQGDTYNSITHVGLALPNLLKPSKKFGKVKISYKFVERTISQGLENREVFCHSEFFINHLWNCSSALLPCLTNFAFTFASFTSFFVGQLSSNSLLCLTCSGLMD